MSDLPMQQVNHPAHKMPPPKYSNDVLGTTPQERNTMFSYDSDMDVNTGKGPVQDEARRNQ